ncbi:unnamed protein product [Trichobilharzia regenti]|nr:unnamed protein product [Trichobilharzia regenti]
MNSGYCRNSGDQDNTPCQRRIMRSNNLVTSSSFDLPNKDRAQQQTPSAETSIQRTTQQPQLPMELGTDLDTNTPVNGVED